MQPDLQQSFSLGLLDPETMPEGIVDPKGRRAPKRFDVYRNNVVTSLTEALGATYPAVRALVGDTFFVGMAQAFVRQSPPQSPLLTEYGGNFYEFIAGFAPARGLTFLADVARLDWAWLQSYHAADARALDPSAFAGRRDEELMSARFEPHPATRLVVSDFPVVRIWRAARDGLDSAGSLASSAESALVTRPQFQVAVSALDPASTRFFQILLEGGTLGEAADTALAAGNHFNLSAALGVLFGSGGMAGVYFD